MKTKEIHLDPACPSYRVLHSREKCGLGRSKRGSVLLIALSFVVLLTVTVAALLSFAGTESVMITRRSNQIDAVYGAEAAVRRSMAQIRQLYFSNYSTNSYLTGNLAAPTDSEISILSSSQGPATLSALNDRYNFTSISVAFTTGSSANRYVSYAIPSTDEHLSAYAGLTSQRATIQCSAETTAKNSRYEVPGRIQQAFNIDYIPVFQYAIFYNMDMEVFNGPTMTVNGKVHSNGTLYYAPADTLTINANLTTSDDIERGLKLWDPALPKLLTDASAAVQAQYQNNQSLYEADPANWVSTDPTVTGYGEASFKVKNATTSASVDFRTSSSPATFYDSESTGWAGGALTKWGGGVKTEDQGIDDVPPPIPDDVIASATDPSNPYHVMIEHPNLNSGGASTDSSAVKSAKMASNATLLIQRSGAEVIFKVKDTIGNWHVVSNASTNLLRNASSIVPSATATVRDQREYLQNGSVKMTVTDFDVSALYGAGGVTTDGAMNSSGVWQMPDGTALSTDASGTAFTPVAFDGTVYIYDDDYSSTRKPGIRIKNGATIYDKDSNSAANNGIAVISENPVYVQGNFNSDGNTSTGPEKTGGSKENVPPAMIAGDVLNVLSTAWVSGDDDPGGSAGTSNYFLRQSATTTEINAAILAGVNHSSQDAVVSSFNGTTGGVNNFPHFLEHWSSTFKYSGSMVSLWYGAQSVSKYRGAGTANGVFSAPTRDWAFNTDFLDPNKLPRSTPIIRVYTTANWKNY